jgi:outer membrane protein
MKGEINMNMPVRKSIQSAILITVMAVVVFLLPPLHTCAWGQENNVERQMTVIQAIRSALLDNHEIRAMKSSSMAQGSDIGVARSYLLPKVNFEERYSRTTNPTYAFMDRLNQERITQQDFNPDLLNHPDAIGDYQTSVTIEQPVFIRKAFISLDISKKEALAKDDELKRKREEVAFQVFRACLMIISAKEYIKAVQQGVDDAKEHLRVANLRYNNNLGQYSDTLRASTALMDAQQKRNSAEKNLSLAKRTLGLLLSTSETIDVADNAIELPFKDLPIYVKAAESRGDIRAAQLRQENAYQNIRMVESGYLPYLGVGGSYQFNDHDRPFGSEGDSWLAMAFLRWDLFDGTKREYERAKAKHLASQATEQLAAYKQGVSYRIAEAYMDVEEARKNSELAREALKTAEEGARLVRLRYENGLMSLSDLLSAQTSLEQARAGLVARENAYRLAVATLSFESGTILKDLNVEG